MLIFHFYHIQLKIDHLKSYHERNEEEKYEEASCPTESEPALVPIYGVFAKLKELIL